LALEDVLDEFNALGSTRNIRVDLADRQN